MVRHIEGRLRAADHRFAVVASRFNESITSKLVAGALAGFAEHGVDESSIDVVWVPGAFEIPLAADYLVTESNVAAVVCLGAVIRGETTHDQHINRALSEGLMDVALRSSCPVLFGVLTCDNLEQAIHRSGGNQGNKGHECALAALRMADLLAQLDAMDGECLPHPAGQRITATVGEEHGAS
jgi:6,7-dimethyl-8-ribityllumazine synthase